ncbi:hypothetical protein Btru_071260 [Bulinus truncatus]|nr:hypothetical protein Btru_071260 [Bulinus truncatus]
MDNGGDVEAWEVGCESLPEEIHPEISLETVDGEGGDGAMAQDVSAFESHRSVKLLFGLDFSLEESKPKAVACGTKNTINVDDFLLLLNEAVIGSSQNGVLLCDVTCMTSKAVTKLPDSIFMRQRNKLLSERLQLQEASTIVQDTGVELIYTALVQGACTIVQDTGVELIYTALVQGACTIVQDTGVELIYTALVQGACTIVQDTGVELIYTAHVQGACTIVQDTGVELIYTAHVQGACTIVQDTGVELIYTALVQGACTIVQDTGVELIYTAHVQGAGTGYKLMVKVCKSCTGHRSQIQRAGT